MWIRLTLAHNETPILVNLDKLTSILPYPRSDGVTAAKIYGDGGGDGDSSCTVLESFDEIQARISALIIPE